MDSLSWTGVFATRWINPSSWSCWIFNAIQPVTDLRAGAPAVEEEKGYQYVIDPIEPGGTWVFRDFLVGDPYRNSLLLFGDCEDRKLESDRHEDG